MKKKRAIIISIAAVVVTFCIGGYILAQPPRLNADRISKIQVTSYPSPPKSKNVTEKEDIQKIVSSFNGLHLTPRISISTPAGTSIWIETTGDRQSYKIIMTGSIVQINSFTYNCNEDAAKRMRELYQNLSYPEEDYTKLTK